MKRLIMAVSVAAMTVATYSPQEKVDLMVPQTTVTESELKAQEPQTFRGNVHQSLLSQVFAPNIASAATAPKSKLLLNHTPVKNRQQKMNSTEKTEQNLIDHMLKHKVSEKNAQKWARIIMIKCKTYGTDPYTVLAMIQVESGFNPNLVGSSNDTGLLQVLPSTQKDMGIKGSLFNPNINIEVGIKYLAFCQKRFGKDLGIVAYNQGVGNVSNGNYKIQYLNKVKRALSLIDR